MQNKAIKKIMAIIAKQKKIDAKNIDVDDANVGRPTKEISAQRGTTAKKFTKVTESEEGAPPPSTRDEPEKLDNPDTKKKTKKKKKPVVDDGTPKTNSDNGADGKIVINRDEDIDDGVSETVLSIVQRILGEESSIQRLLKRMKEMRAAGVHPNSPKFKEVTKQYNTLKKAGVSTKTRFAAKSVVKPVAAKPDDGPSISRGQVNVVQVATRGGVGTVHVPNHKSNDYRDHVMKNAKLIRTAAIKHPDYKKDPDGAVVRTALDSWNNRSQEKKSSFSISATRK